MKLTSSYEESRELVLMPRNPFNFDHKKATQTLNYFALKAGGKINKMKALKLIFLADRFHLRKYGRLITNDCYVAMNYGPVPSTIMDIAKANVSHTYKAYASRYIKATDTGRQIESISSVDNSYFSDSDIEALDFAWDNFGHHDKWDLSDFTHRYPEWKKHKEALDSGSKVEKINLKDFFEDPEGNVNKCYELDEEERSLRREQLDESAYLESLWR
jgi:uncharacterized phage-associated protein